MNEISFSYNKLWKLLIDRGMKKKDLQQASGVSAASIAKLGRNGNVTTEVLLKVCKALGFQLVLSVNTSVKYLRKLNGGRVSILKLKTIQKK